VDGAALQPVTVRPPLTAYLGQLWGRRYFVHADARARVRSRSRGALLGTAWLVLRPVLDAAVYLVVFGLVLRVDRGIDNFLGYLVIGTFMFQFTVRTLSAGSQSLIAGRPLMKAFAFPRAVLPIATVTREVVSYGPVLAAMVVLLLALPTRPELSWRWLLVPLAVALQVLLCLGLALLLARPTARVPDLQHLIAFGSRFWLYGSAVFFSFERFVEHPAILRAIELNPMFQVLDITRDCLLYGATPTPTAWVTLGSWAVGAAVVGLVVFWRGEERYGAL
jgi:teichoic acid transport system permease protein